MRKFILAIAMAWQASQVMAAACNVSGFKISGFETPATCVASAEAPMWTSSVALSSVVPGTFTGVNANTEGDDYGRIIYSAASASMTLTAANFPVALGNNWSNIGTAAPDFMVMNYATTRTASAFFTTEYYLINGATTWFFTAAATNVSKAAIAVATDWTPLILSLNYAKNLGLAMDNVASVTVRQKGTGGAVPYEIGFDDLSLIDGGDTPNTPLIAGDVAAVASCSNYNVTLTAQAQTGTDPIVGYHVYRSTNGAGGPYLSHKYVNNAPTLAFTEQAPFYNGVYYKILPYSGATTAFNGGAQGYFVKGGNGFVDPVNSQVAAGGGVHEALLAAAAAIGPYDQLASCPPTPTPTFTPTLTFSLTYSYTSTYTVTPTDTPTSTFTSTFTATPTSTPTFTATPTATPSNTPGPTNTPAPTNTAVPTSTSAPTNTPAPTNTSVPTNTAVPTNTPGPSNTVTSTFTSTPIVTNTVVVGVPAQLYPNPFNPDKELFYLGNVPANERMNIYNLIGERVYTVVLRGNPAYDFWDGLNSNGVKVVTGIYFVVIQGNVYRLAVVRN